MSALTVPAPILVVRGLSASYGRVEAIHDISLQVMPGQITSVIGPNGAGKTTLLAAIMGLMSCRGEISFCGDNQQGVKIEQRVLSGMSLIPEKRELFATMTVQDNLLLGAYARFSRGEHGYQESLHEMFMAFPRLAERRSQMAGTLSGGERAMLVLGRGLMSKPKLLLLDEPSLGLAPLIVKDMFSAIVKLRESGVAVLLVEQNARAALQISNYAYVLETGSIAMEGPSADLAHDPRIAATYLGSI